MIKLTFIPQTELEKATLEAQCEAMGALWTEESGNSLMAFFDALPEGHPFGEPQIETVNPTDWKTVWGKHFESFDWVEGWQVCSIGTAVSAPKTLLIDAADAFGDGKHPTTTLCAAALIGVLEGRNSLSNFGLLDVGTGTGILSILGWKLGVKNPVGLDCDAEAIERALQNAKANGWHTPDFRCQLLADVPEEVLFDAIVANINSAILEPLLPEISQRLKPGGVAILSGVGLQWADAFVQKIGEAGLGVMDQTASEGWLCFKTTRLSDLQN
ncbi:MAG: 50S ribosomal protein L11 methyltransferase [Candidatus Margulisiibacteriota bacterium]